MADKVTVCIACDEPIDRELPDPIPEDYELMMSEAFTQTALYCTNCYG